MKKTLSQEHLQESDFSQLYHLYTFSNYTPFTGSWELTFNFEVK